MIAVDLARFLAKEAAMDHVVNMHEAKTQLSKLVARAQQGKSVTIAIHGKPAVKLVPIRAQPKAGLMKDKWPPVPWTSFAPMSDEDAAEWGF
jgi:prevent-host-death family protein